jgi:hypothetical protein
MQAQMEHKTILRGINVVSEGRMTTARTAEIGDVLKRPIRLPDTVENLHAKYLAARPFPHLILDGLFSDEAMEELLDDIPSLRDDRWVHHEEKRLTKSNLRSVVDPGEIGHQHLSFLYSAAFAYLLEGGVWRPVGTLGYRCE